MMLKIGKTYQYICSACGGICVWEAIYSVNELEKEKSLGILAGDEIGFLGNKEIFILLDVDKNKQTMKILKQNLIGWIRAAPCKKLKNHYFKEIG